MYVCIYIYSTLFAFIRYIKDTINTEWKASRSVVKVLVFMCVCVCVCVCVVCVSMSVCVCVCVGGGGVMSVRQFGCPRSELNKSVCKH
jgi:hypothetical protein